jgi:hypothetical protein
VVTDLHYDQITDEDGRGLFKSVFSRREADESQCILSSMSWPLHEGTGVLLTENLRYFFIHLLTYSAVA